MDISSCKLSYTKTPHPLFNLVIPNFIDSLRAVTTSDFMSAEPYEFPFALLKAIARRIVNEVDGVSRVTYDLYAPLSPPDSRVLAKI